MPTEPILVIDRGDLPSLVACALEPVTDRLILFHVIEPDDAARRREAIVAERATRWNVRRLIRTRAMDLGIRGMAPEPGLFESAVLLQAAVAARQAGSRRVIWPKLIGPNGDLVPAAVDRADTVAALAALDREHRELAIDLPIVDLTDVQLVELAEDAGAPMSGFWPCCGAGERPCDTCEPCRRWQAAFDGCHLPWPWAPPVIDTSAAPARSRL